MKGSQKSPIIPTLKMLTNPKFNSILQRDTQPQKYKCILQLQQQIIKIDTLTHDISILNKLYQIYAQYYREFNEFLKSDPKKFNKQMSSQDPLWRSQLNMKDISIKSLEEYLACIQFNKVVLNLNMFVSMLDERQFQNKKVSREKYKEIMQQTSKCLQKLKENLRSLQFNPQSIQTSKEYILILQNILKTTINRHNLLQKKSKNSASQKQQNQLLNSYQNLQKSIQNQRKLAKFFKEMLMRFCEYRQQENCKEEQGKQVTQGSDNFYARNHSDNLEDSNPEVSEKSLYTASIIKIKQNINISPNSTDLLQIFQILKQTVQSNKFSSQNKISIQNELKILQNFYNNNSVSLQKQELHLYQFCKSHQIQQILQYIEKNNLTLKNLSNIYFYMNNNQMISKEFKVVEKKIENHLIIEDKKEYEGFLHQIKMVQSNYLSKVQSQNQNQDNLQSTQLSKTESENSSVKNIPPMFINFSNKRN